MSQRRLWLQRASASMLALGWASAQAQGSAPKAGDAHQHHDHGSATSKPPAKAATKATPKGLDELLAVYQTCLKNTRRCISHCQKLLASGDKSVGMCLRTALDVEVSCDAVLRLAGTESSFTGAYAKTSLAVMQACVDACKEHVDHHAECKACHDSCLAAMAAARKFG